MTNYKLIVFSSKNDPGGKLRELFGTYWENFKPENPFLVIRESGCMDELQNLPDPNIVIVWEPTAGSYSTERENIHKSLKQWHDLKPNETMYFVLHNNTRQEIHEIQRVLMQNVAGDYAVERKSYSHSLQDSCYKKFTEVGTATNRDSKEYHDALAALFAFLSPVYDAAIEIMASFLPRYMNLSPTASVAADAGLENDKIFLQRKDKLRKALRVAFPAIRNNAEETDNIKKIFSKINCLRHEQDFNSFEKEYLNLREMMFEHIVQRLKFG